MLNDFADQILDRRNKRLGDFVAGRINRTDIRRGLGHGGPPLGQMLYSAPATGDGSPPRRSSVDLLNHLIRPLQERRRDREAERLGGLEVDDQFVLSRLLDGQVGGLGAFEDLVHVTGGAAVKIS
jgi:hypothetical protein